MTSDSEKPKSPGNRECLSCAELEKERDAARKLNELDITIPTNLLKERDSLAQEVERLKEEHEKFCEDAQDKTDADFKVVRDENEKLKAELEQNKKEEHELLDLLGGLDNKIESYFRKKYRATLAHSDKLIEGLEYARSIVTLTHPELEKVEMNTLTTRQYILFKKLEYTIDAYKEFRGEYGTKDTKNSAD